MNRLYEKYLGWRLRKVNSKIQGTQLFINVHQNFDIVLDMNCVSRQYKRLNELQSRKKGLINKLNYEPIDEAIKNAD